MAASLNSCDAEILPNVKLGIHRFVTDPKAESIEHRLKPKFLNQPQSKKSKKKETKEEKTRNKEHKKISENQEKFYNRPTQNIYNTGSGHIQWDINAAADTFLKRDYPKIGSISETGVQGHIGQAIVPETWLSGAPGVVDIQNGKDKLKLLECEGNPVANMLRSDIIKMKGERSEKSVYFKLTEYYEEINEEVVLIHSAHILEPDVNKRGQKSAFEKDFLVISKTHQYVLNIEVKSSLSLTKHDNKSTMESSLEQVSGAKKLLEDYFGGDLSDDWKFIGVVFTDSVEANLNFCLNCNPFIIIGEANIKQKMKNIFEELRIIRPTFTASPMVFRTIAKHLLFTAHASPAPTTSNIGGRVVKNVEKAGSADSIAVWSLWTPGQLSLVKAENLQFVLFASSFSTGKTKCLLHSALNKARSGKKVLILICNNNTKKKTLLQMTLNESIKSENAVTRSNITLDFFCLQKGESFIPVLEDKMKDYTNHSVYVDELFLPRVEEHSKMAENLDKLLPLLNGCCLWLAIAGIYKGKLQDFENFKDVFKSFYIPLLRFPLRSTRAIVSEALPDTTNTTVQIGPAYLTHIDLDLPDNLVEGVAPVYFKFLDPTDRHELFKAILKAFQLVQQTEGTSGVTILTNGYGIQHFETICDAANDAGRPTPLWYSCKDGVGDSTAMVAEWLVKRDRDLVTDDWISRGWEDNTIIVVDMNKIDTSRIENLAMRTISRLIIVQSE